MTHSNVTDEMIEAGAKAFQKAAWQHPRANPRAAAEIIYRDMLKAQAHPTDEEEVDALPTNCELSFYSPTYGDDDDQAREWRVHSINGGINDREWTLIGTGETPTQAIRAALNAIRDTQGDKG